MKRLARILAAAILGVSSLMVFGVPATSYAASGSDTCTWTGGGSDSNFSTAANWSNCSSAAPVNGDSLVFDSSSLTASETINNDLSTLGINSITFTNNASNYNGYTISGNNMTINSAVDVTGTNTGAAIQTDITLGGNVVVNVTQSAGYLVFASDKTLNTSSHTLSFSGYGGNCGVEIQSNLAGNGTVSSSVWGLFLYQSHSSSFTGNFNITNGLLGVNGPETLGQAAGITVSGTGTLGLASNATYTTPLTLSGSGYTTYAAYQYGTILSGQSFTPCRGGYSPTHYKVNISAPVVLNSDITVSGSEDIKFTGEITSNNHTISVLPGSQGTLTLPSGQTKEAPAQTISIPSSDSNPSAYVTIGKNQTYSIDGTRGSTTIESGGILKGNGTVGNLTVYSGGTVAPGHSPGKLTVLDQLTLQGGATLQEEIKNSEPGGYDQIVVGEPSDTTGNVVALGDSSGSSTLQVSLYSDFSIKAGDQFKIIDNKSKTPVSGTFNDLPEGTAFAADSYVFKISYKGGDGNDVVLTVQSIPGTPDTGFMLLKSNPAVTLLATTAAAGGLLLIARRTRKLATKR